MGWGPAGWLLRISQFFRLKSTTVPSWCLFKTAQFSKAFAAPTAVIAGSAANPLPEPQCIPNAFHQRAVAMGSEISKTGGLDSRHLTVK